MVIVTATPPITFLAYATNIITRHARKKEEQEYTKVRQKEDKDYQRSYPKPSSRYLKSLRKRSSKKDASKKDKGKTTRLHSDKPGLAHPPESHMVQSRASIVSSNHGVAHKVGDEDKLIPNGALEPPNYFDNSCHNVPIYDQKNRYVAAIVNKGPAREAIMSKYRPLHHPLIARAYWWQGTYCPTIINK